MVSVYAPDGVPDIQQLSLTPFPVPGPTLRIGILQNNKPNAGLLLATAATTLAARLGAPAPVLMEKERASLPAPQSVVDHLVAHADLVFVGTAD